MRPNIERTFGISGKRTFGPREQSFLKYRVPLKLNWNTKPNYVIPENLDRAPCLSKQPLFRRRRRRSVLALSSFLAE